jgi:hypothetical protein
MAGYDVLFNGTRNTASGKAHSIADKLLHYDSVNS